jgi:DNA-binding transcriptional LysR family regulator
MLSFSMVRRLDRLPFDLRSLEIFLAVCETGSMGAAARQLGLTQPAVSLAIADLERKSGVVLFDRKARPIGPTAAGLLLRKRAEQLLADAQQIPGVLRELRHGKVPRCRVGMITSLSRLLIPEMTRFLLDRASQVSILTGLAAQPPLLLSRRVDVAIGPDDLGDVDGMERWPIVDEPLILLLSKRLARKTGSTDIDRLAAAAPLIRFPTRAMSGAEVDRYLRRLGLNVPRTLEMDSASGAVAAAAADLGWTVTTPLCILDAGLPLATLLVHPLPDATLGRTITLVAHAQELGPLPRELAVFIAQTLRDKARALMARVGPSIRNRFVLRSG